MYYGWERESINLKAFQSAAGHQVYVVHTLHSGLNNFRIVRKLQYYVPTIYWTHIQMIFNLSKILPKSLKDTENLTSVQTN